MEAGSLAATLGFAAIIAFQLFVPPSVGVANNGDYGKLIGRFSLGPVDPKNLDERDYYEQHWRYDPAYHWVSDNYSSEIVPVAVALRIGRLFSSHLFDMRILGAIHAALWIGCFVAALPLFPGWTRWLAVFIFTDVSYIAYLNSFHTDTVAFLFLAWAIVIALRMAASDWTGWIPFAALLFSSLMFITAKPQHSLVGIPLVLIAIGQPRAAGLLFAVLLPLAAVLTLQHVPESERKVEMFNAIFAKVLRHSPSPATDLRELGLPPDLQRWIGHYADEPDQPTLQPEVRDALTPAAHRRLALFAIRHPMRTFDIIYSDLGVPAANRRPPFLGNYERSTGFPPHTLARSFYWWSAFRSFWFRIAPWHVLVWYALFAGAACCFARNRIAVIALVLAVQGLMELGFAALGDIGETDRHLWLFHVITDITIIFAVCSIVPIWKQSRHPA